MKKKILFVDDELDVLDLVTIRLRKAGYEIIEAVDAEVAMGIIQKTRPDLILLDLLLPGMQGDELCKKLKSNPKYKKIPILLFTASTMRVPGMVKEIGADDCIVKPFEPDELIYKIKRLIDSYRVKA